MGKRGKSAKWVLTNWTNCANMGYGYILWLVNEEKRYSENAI